MGLSTDKLISILIAVVMFASLGGTIASTVTDAAGNFSGASAVLWGLTTLFVVIIFIRALAKTK